MKFIFTWVAFVSISAWAQISRQELDGLLRGPNGVALEVHAAPEGLKHYVGTWRDPENFFIFEHYSLVPHSAEVASSFAQLKRHDRIRVWGSVLTDMRAPQGHLEIERIVVESAGADLGHFIRQARLDAGFPAENEFFYALVHAVDPESGLLVVEYKDTVLPVRVPSAIHLPQLFKNDVVKMRATLATHPHEPQHLKLLELVVESSIVNIHGQAIDKTGELVRFPASPQVRFDVWAIREDLGHGLSRQYTLINFDDKALFDAIRAKAAAFWQAADASGIVNGRNKLVNMKLRVRARGMGNMVDPGQANAQIVLSSLDDLTVADEKPAR